MQRPFPEALDLFSGSASAATDLSAALGRHMRTLNGAK